METSTTTDWVNDAIDNAEENLELLQNQEPNENIDNIKEDLTEQITVLVESIENNIKFQTKYLDGLLDVKDPDESVEKEIKQTKNILDINNAFLKQAIIVRDHKFDLSPISDYFVNASKLNSVDKLKKFPKRYLVELNEAIKKLEKQKQVKFHHPDHIAKVFGLLGLDEEMFKQFIGVLSLYINKVSLRTNLMYIRYILSYFGNLFKALVQFNTIEIYKSTEWPDGISEEYKQELLTLHDNSKDYITNQKEIITNAISTLLKDVNY